MDALNSLHHCHIKICLSSNRSIFTSSGNLTEMSLQLSQESEGTCVPSFKEGTYGVPDPMIHKFGSVRSDVLAKHPLETSEKKHFESQTNFDMAMMKRIQGIHAPLRLVMEREAAMKVQRLPFLTSSNAMLDALTGRDESIGFESIFGDPENSDSMSNPSRNFGKRFGIHVT